MGNIVHNNKSKGLGGLPDYPRFKDYTPQSAGVSALFKKVDLDKNLKSSILKESLPVKQDLRKWCSPVEDQKSLGSCTANAGVGIIEYFEKRAEGKYIDASRMFLYKVTRNLLNFKGDTGAFLRGATSAGQRCCWPYVDSTAYQWLAGRIAERLRLEFSQEHACGHHVGRLD